jgi:predicted transcriptional regulator
MNEIIEKRTNRGEDEAIESAVLHQLLDLHPARLTLEELKRELGTDREGYADRDALERAVRDLAAVGLLHRETEFVEPTRAAVRFSELLDR